MVYLQTPLKGEIYSVDIEINMTLLFWWIHTVQKSRIIFGRNEWGYKIMLSLYTSSSRGVAICFKNNPKAQQKIHALMAELDLVDVWRKNNPSVKRYTWRGPNRKRSRLDFLLVSSDLETFVINSDIGVSYKSDHSPVYLTFQCI